MDKHYNFVIIAAFIIIFTLAIVLFLQLKPVLAGSNEYCFNAVGIDNETKPDFAALGCTSEKLLCLPENEFCGYSVCCPEKIPCPLGASCSN